MCNGVMAYTHVCTCVCFRAHVGASMCSGIHSRVHHVHMRVLPSTGARTRVSRHTLMCAAAASCSHACAYDHICVRVQLNFMCSCVCFRAHVRARAFSCTNACASEHMWVQACAAAYTHACIMCTCVCFRARVRASVCHGVHSCVHHVRRRASKQVQAKARCVTA